MGIQRNCAMSNCLLGFQQLIIKDIDQVEKDQLLKLFLSHPPPEK